jgi:hypothetical protein
LLQSNVAYPIGHRAFGFSLEPGYQGILMALLSPFVFHTFPKYKHLISLSLIVSLIATSSLTGFILILQMLVYFSFKNNFLFYKFPIKKIIFFILILMVVAISMFKYIDYFYNNILDAFFLNSESAIDRFNGFINGVNFFLDSNFHFIFGHGLGFSSTQNINFVNFYLLLLVDGGRCLLFLFLLYLLFTYLNSRRIDPVFRSTLTISFIMIITSLLFNQLFFLPINLVLLNLINSGIFLEQNKF